MISTYQNNLKIQKKLKLKNKKIYQKHGWTAMPNNT